MTFPSSSLAAAPRALARRRMRVVIGMSTLGLVLVAHGELGINAVLFGDDRDALHDELQRRFPDAALVEADPVAQAIADRVIASIESPALAPDVTLDPQGTPFQRLVWQALRDVPPGTTVTYREIAERVGAPSSARAVAQACAANAIAVVVPCHRVVRSDGSLSGYRWGVERKRALLEREGVK